MYDTKKGRYTEEENEQIITSLNEGLAQGKNEREIIKELSVKLNRGYAGVMSHIRKLRHEMPDRFTSDNDLKKSGSRLNSWTEEEEKLVIDTVNQFSKAGNPLSAAISALEKKLSRTQGAIYQRIYTLRNKHPELFFKKPLPRPRRRPRLDDWQVHRSLIRTAGRSSYLNPSMHKKQSNVDYKKWLQKLRQSQPLETLVDMVLMIQKKGWFLRPLKTVMDERMVRHVENWYS